MNLEEDIKETISETELSVGKYINLIILVGEALFVLVLLVRFFLPSYEDIKQKRFEIEQGREKLADVTSYAQYLEELANSTLAIEEEIINYALPSENDVVTLILTYEGVARTEGVEVSPIDLSPGILEHEERELEEGETGVQEVSFDMTVAAEDDEAARSFISSVTNTRRIFDIMTLSWTDSSVQESGSTTSEDGTISLDLSINTYYYVQPQITTSRSLVREGQEQSDFVAQLSETTVFEDLILEGVEVGKEDLFARISTFSARLN